MDYLKLISRNEKGLQKGLTIVRAINKDIKMNFGLDKCARIRLEGRRDQSKMHIRSTTENDIKELDPRKAYLGIGESYNLQRKNEKEELKKEYFRGLRLVLGTELRAKNKI